MSVKFFLLVTCLFAGFAIKAQKHALIQLWQTDTVVAIPESVLPVPEKNILYVSLVEGGGWDMDGKGGVARLSPDGKHYDSTWISGLNAPKGLGIYGNRIYAADISEVVVINIPERKIIKKIPIEGASGLNDITVTDKGVVFVSDSKTSRVWRIENDKPELYLENIKGVNGLKAIKSDLFIGGGQSFIKADAHKNLKVIVELPEHIDGIEPVGNNDFLVTAWVGYIYYVYADGRYETLLDTHLEKKNTADIGYDAQKKTVYVPTFNGKRVVAYRLK